MDNSFDAAHAKYLASLAKLDETDDITQKNMLFRELADLLAEMENSLKRNGNNCGSDGSSSEHSELIYWI